MADDSQLRGMLQREAAEAAEPELDAGRLVRRARARRLPRQLAAGGALTLAVIGLGVGTVSGVRLFDPPASVTSAESGGDSADDGMDPFAGEEAAPESDTGGAAGGGIELAPAYKVNACGGMLTAAPEIPGLGVELRFPEEADRSGTVRGTVEITNDTGERLRGVLSDTAATTLSQNEVVLWHTPRLERTSPVDLAPGESTTLQATFEARTCAPEDEGAEDFRAGLPPVDPGRYEVSVAFDLQRDDGSVLQVVSGTVPITLR